jgi:hypothetical protein
MFLISTIFIFSINHQSLTYELNKECYDRIEGKLINREVDNLMFTIPLLNIEYTYNGEVHEVQKLDLLDSKHQINSSIGLYVNKKAPKYVLLARADRFDSASLLWLSVWVLSIYYIFKYIYLCIRYHVINKGYREINAILLEYAKRVSIYDIVGINEESDTNK